MDATTIYRDARNRSLGMVYLRPEAHAAYVLWLNRWYGRIDQQRGLLVRDELDATKLTAYGDVCAQLAEYVIADAAAADLPPQAGAGAYMSGAEFAAAQRIRAEHDRLDLPPPPPVLAWDDSEVCSHGVSIDADCHRCDM
jgi:hypothetical protein